ncbi:MAG: biopolymer transporter ExbD [Bdellovibrio sp.]|nr:biopolymer transporter ExbD [Bdellovibrio sp.]
MKASVLKNLHHHSPLDAMRRVQAGGGGKKEKSLFFALNLTTLIDAFCILVIFLLSNMNGRVQNLKESEKLVLPTAMRSEALTEGVVVRIERNSIFVDDKKIVQADLAKAILASKTKDNVALIIQADRKSDYENIGLVLRAGGQAGYEKYVFAVLPGT